MKKLLSLVIVLGLLVAATGCPSTPTTKPGGATPAPGAGDKAGEKK